MSNTDQNNLLDELGDFMAVWSMTVKNGIKGKCVLAMSGLVGGAWGFSL